MDVTATSRGSAFRAAVIMGALLLLPFASFAAMILAVPIGLLLPVRAQLTTTDAVVYVVSALVVLTLYAFALAGSLHPRRERARTISSVLALLSIVGAFAALPSLTTPLPTSPALRVCDAEHLVREPIALGATEELSPHSDRALTVRHARDHLFIGEADGGGPGEIAFERPVTEPLRVCRRRFRGEDALLLEAGGQGTFIRVSPTARLDDSFVDRVANRANPSLWIAIALLMVAAALPLVEQTRRASRRR